MLITSSHKTATPSTRNVGNGFFLMFVYMFVNLCINRMNVWSQTAIDFDMKLKIQFISFEHYKLLLLHSLRRSTNFFHHPLPSMHFSWKMDRPSVCLKIHDNIYRMDWSNGKTDRKKQLHVTKHHHILLVVVARVFHMLGRRILEMYRWKYDLGESEKENGKNAYPQLPSSINFSINNCVGNGKAICFPPCARWFFSINLSLSINTFYWFSLVSRIRKTYHSSRRWFCKSFLG